MMETRETRRLKTLAKALSGPGDTGLHVLWRQAVEQPDYDKSWWKSRSRELELTFPREGGWYEGGT